jgi:hypothetical protein
MIRWLVSPALGMVCVYDTPFPPGLARWAIPFHVEELAVMRRKFVTAQMWQDVALVKSLIPGTLVVAVDDVAARRKRWERRRKRTRLWSSGPPVPEPESDADD